ncbi:hypothetical protein RFI_03350 [Reticulomyxa filosa]|uniref:Carbohydrate kinase PfkB domain-containing protein n=1 Tax=Reticulomyxa filosa TaxID=46433 RepID=X6P6L5_RETFI|nr:hypothetical protein RFI_03350 [Reticulomyxa filosa]|eukprot:ETO33753.1 hypothetical protein RFI_03350 [Reticulomyxa filosa]
MSVVSDSNNKDKADSTSNKKKRNCITVIGDFFLDIQTDGLKKLPGWNEDNIVPSISLLPGGSAGNMARQMANFVGLNQEVYLISCIGNDRNGKLLLSMVSNEHCHFDRVVSLNTYCTPTCIVLSSAVLKERTFVTCNNALNCLCTALLLSPTEVKKSPTEQSEVETQSLDVRQAMNIPNLSHIHFGGYYNSIGLHKDKHFLKFVSKCKEQSITLSLDTQTPLTDIVQQGGTHPVMKLLFELLIWVKNKQI